MDLVRVCKTCGAEFTIEEGEKKWLEEKGFNLPSHCRNCRKLKNKNRPRNIEGVVPKPFGRSKNGWENYKKITKE